LFKIVIIHAKTNIVAETIYYKTSQGAKTMSTTYCPECGGECHYMIGTKLYVCKSCGLSVTQQELMDLREKNRPKRETEDEERENRRKDYLKWWLSKK
jgi:ribosomal protein L37AE/L43A